MDIYNQTRLAEHEELLIELEQKLYGAGIDIEDIEIEYGNGQFEMTMKPARGVLAADQAFLLKQGVKVSTHITGTRVEIRIIFFD